MATMGMYSGDIGNDEWGDPLTSGNIADSTSGQVSNHPADCAVMGGMLNVPTGTHPPKMDAPSSPYDPANAGGVGEP